MKFLVDECLGYRIAEWLRSEQYDVLFVGELALGSDDDSILKTALREKRTVITADKDFGDIIFFHNRSHNGVILLRLRRYNSIELIKSVIQNILQTYHDEIPSSFIVATESASRVINFNK